MVSPASPFVVYRVAHSRTAVSALDIPIHLIFHRRFPFSTYIHSALIITRIIRVNMCLYPLLHPRETREQIRWWHYCELCDGPEESGFDFCRAAVRVEKTTLWTRLTIEGELVPLRCNRDSNRRLGVPCMFSDSSPVSYWPRGPESMDPNLRFEEVDFLTGSVSVDTRVGVSLALSSDSPPPLMDESD